MEDENMIVNTNDNRTNSEYNQKCKNCIWHKRVDAWNLVCINKDKWEAKPWNGSSWLMGNSMTMNNCKYYEACGLEVSAKMPGKATVMSPTIKRLSERELERSYRALERAKERNEEEEYIKKIETKIEKLKDRLGRA